MSSENEITAIERLSNPNIEAKVIKSVDHYLTAKLAPRYFMNVTAINEIINWTLEK